MGGRIGQFARAVAGARDQRPVADNRRADRRFATQLGRPRLGEGEAQRIAAWLWGGVADPARRARRARPKAAAARFSFCGSMRSGLGQASHDGNAGAGVGDEAGMNEETKAEVSPVRPGQRIAKVMARAGVCSRRDAEAWIAEGRVSVNGAVLSSPAFNVSEADDVRVDGKRLGAAERTRLFLFHKPRGFVTTARDPEGRPTVFEALPPGLPRVVAIGRLDINTEGLLLLTNDGGLARVLELPSTGWLRRYRVRAHGVIDQAALDALSGGIGIDGVDYLGIEAKLDREQGSNVWITLGLREEKNREIKKVLEHLGLAVNRLIRVSFGPFELGDLAVGEAAEVRTRVLRDQLGAKLAREAQADFDAPLAARDAPPPKEPMADERTARSTAPGRDRSGAISPCETGSKDAARGAGDDSTRTPRRAPRRRCGRCPSAGASMSRACGRRSPPTRRRRASASSAARPTTARGGQPRSNAFHQPERKRGGAPPPKPASHAEHGRGRRQTRRERARGFCPRVRLRLPSMGVPGPLLLRAYRCITYNARGYPPSDVPEDADLYGWEFSVNDIAAVMQGLAIERAHVVGLSMGAYAALQFGLRFPEKADAIVAAGVGSGSPPSARSAWQEQSRALAQGFIERGMAAMAQEMAHNPQTVSS